MKRLLSTKLYRWYIEELREEILDIIHSETSGLSHQARLDEIQEVLKDTIEEQDK